MSNVDAPPVDDDDVTTSFEDGPIVVGSGSFVPTDEQDG